jgi:protein-S-isoprenylcysteine O-methyltransferase Ste14
MKYKTTFNSEDRARILIPPPLLFFACLGVGIILEFLFPSRPFSWPWIPRIIAACILSLISGLLAIGAFIPFLRNKTPFNPSKQTVRIVREGSFRFSRHPMYLSLVIFLAGVAVLFCSLWLFIMIPILFVAFEIIAVRPEEKYLSQKFGDEYSDYKASVRRWI